MEYRTDRVSNPFDMRPSCERYVPGYGDVAADFHVIGDHPGIHGGIETGVPFTECESGRRLQEALQEAGLLESTGDEPVVNGTFLSYIHMCVADETPTKSEYIEMEPFFDAELRAIAAHVLFPVGERATRHVLEQYTARPGEELDMAELHARELLGSGWLVMPIREPGEWSGDDHDSLVAGIEELRSTDYRRESDLGRFLPDANPHFVR